MELVDVNTRIINMVEANAASLTQADVAEINDLVAHSEPGVAFEMLCNQLYEHEWPATRNGYLELRALGEQMNLTPSALALWKRSLEL